MTFHMSSLVLIRKSSLINLSFISLVFLVFSLVFSCCVSVFLGILLYLILSLWFYHLCHFLYRNYHSITNKSRAISCHSLFPAWECKQTWLLLNLVPTIDFTSSQFSAHGQWQFSSKCSPSFNIGNLKTPFTSQIS